MQKARESDQFSRAFLLYSSARALMKLVAGQALPDQALHSC
jgi:hypothetical protein